MAKCHIESGARSKVGTGRLSITTVCAGSTCRATGSAECIATHSEQRSSRVGLYGGLLLAVWQPLAVDVPRLGETHRTHQQQAGERQQPHPNRMCVCDSSAWESLGQRIWVPDSSGGPLLPLSMTHSARWRTHPVRKSLD